MKPVTPLDISSDHDRDVIGIMGSKLKITGR